MRELKFRAWNKKYLEMTETFGFEHLRGWDDGSVMANGLDIGHGEDQETGDCYERYIIMQYTELKDKNGKEIYEGDIIQTELRWFNEPRTIINSVSFETVITQSADDEDYSDHTFGWAAGAMSLVEIVSYSEVIGNIYENPELLEVK